MSFLPPLSNSIAATERYHVAPSVGPRRAEAMMDDIIRDGTFRPPDAKTNAKIEEAFALYVPFWRVDIERSDFAVRLSGVRVGGVPIPTARTTEADAVWMICARTAFPYEMKHPSTWLAGDAKPLSVSLAALVPGRPTMEGWERIHPDVDQDRAVRLATAELGKRSGSANALIGESKVNTRAVHYVEYPIWFARYRYRGAASSDGKDLYYVGISAVTGEPITAEHPSKLRAGVARVKSFFTGD